MLKNNLDTSIYEYCAKASWWTPEEAALILSDIDDPLGGHLLFAFMQNEVHQKTIKYDPRVKPILSLLKRAISSKELYYDNGKIKALDCIIWAKKKEIKIRDELEKSVRKYNSVKIEDSVKNYHVSEEDNHKEKNQISEKKDFIVENKKLKEENNILKEKLKTKKYNKKRHNTTLSLMLAFASMSYRKEKLIKNFKKGVNTKNLDQKEKLNISDILKKLQFQGFSFDDETIKDHLQDAIQQNEQTS